MQGYCRTGKIKYASDRAATFGARKLARHLNKHGVIVETLYSYRCGKCEATHLTRLPQWRGAAQRLAFRPAPVDVQMWAMSDEHRERLESAQGRKHNQKQSYANRPRGLRH